MQELSPICISFDVHVVCFPNLESKNCAPFARQIWRANNVDIETHVNCWAKSTESHIYESGDIWICNPENGHWAEDSQLLEFVEWSKRQPFWPKWDK